MMRDCTLDAVAVALLDGHARLEKLIADFSVAARPLKGSVDNLWAMADRDPAFPIAFLTNESDLVHVQCEVLHGRVRNAMHTMPWAVEWFEWCDVVYPALRLRGTTGTPDLVGLTRKHGTLPPPHEPDSDEFRRAMRDRLDPEQLRAALFALLSDNDEVQHGRQ